MLSNALAFQEFPIISTGYGGCSLFVHQQAAVFISGLAVFVAILLKAPGSQSKKVTYKSTIYK